MSLVKPFRDQRFGWGALALLACVVVASFTTNLGTRVGEGVEWISFEFAPSGERAYADGVRHFDAQSPAAYNMSLADYYFTKALALDPSLPYVHHELARIAFIKGNLGDALSLIDTQIAEHGSSTPSSYYMRGLIEGYIGLYDLSAADYARYLLFNPYGWAGYNDYAWVLMKDDQYAKAVTVTAEGLKHNPGNPWLLNSNAIALFETGQLAAAAVSAQEAEAAVAHVTEADWLHAYPGNSPSLAPAGVAALRQAAQENEAKIAAALASSTSPS